MMRSGIILLAGLVLGVVQNSWAASTCTPQEPPLQYATRNFVIFYAESGVDAVPSGDDGSPVSLLDGTVIATVPGGNGISDYVESIGVFLEHARSTYEQAGFKVPAGQVPVFLFADIGAYGLYLPECGEIYLQPNLVLPGTTAVHEMFHAVQYHYWSQEDFAAIPASEQTFYKEATAEWAMIQVMRPTPYISWYDDPDQAGLFQLGASAAFFWIYYLEQQSAWQPGDPLSPGFDAMLAFLERVSRDDLDLAGALAEGPAGSSFAELLEQFTLANLLEDPLKNIVRRSGGSVERYVYQYAMTEGFGNRLEPRRVGLESARAAGQGLEIHLDGVIEHRYGAVYFEIEPEVFGDGCHPFRLSVEGAGGVQGYLVELVTDRSESRLNRLSISRAGSGMSLYGSFRSSGYQRVFVVLYAPSQAHTTFDVMFELLR